MKTLKLFAVFLFVTCYSTVFSQVGGADGTRVLPDVVIGESLMPGWKVTVSHPDAPGLKMSTNFDAPPGTTDVEATYAGQTSYYNENLHMQVTLFQYALEDQDGNRFAGMTVSLLEPDGAPNQNGLGLQIHPY